jgi:hypothetical protein
MWVTTMENDDAMHSDTGQDKPALVGNDWNVPKPDTIPRPTYWPAVLAFGCALAGFGVLTSYIFSILGVLIFILAISKWIGEMVHERQE